MLNLNSVMIGTKRPEVMVDFYAKVLEKPAEIVEVNNGFYGWKAGTTYISILDHSRMEGPTKDPGRVMINFETSRLKEEFERIKALGALVIQDPYEIDGEWIATLADPDGNYFQLITPVI
jgi:predicted enzyme related to lactoylglutathione lyase